MGEEGSGGAGICSTGPGVGIWGEAALISGLYQTGGSLDWELAPSQYLVFNGVHLGAPPLCSLQPQR